MPVVNYSNMEFGKIFQKHIGKACEIKTDEWKGYLPISDKGWKIEQEQSKGGENFELIHRFIMGLKTWIRGIYHHISLKCVQGYLDEYCYRFNRNCFKENAFHRLIQRMVLAKGITYKEISLSA